MRESPDKGCPGAKTLVNEEKTVVGPGLNRMPFIQLRTMNFQLRFTTFPVFSTLKSLASPAILAGLAMILVLGLGCESMPTETTQPVEDKSNNAPDKSIVLREGDAVRVGFPNSKQLDSAQRVRRDGMIVLPVFGEVKAQGLTPAELEAEILKQFGSQLVTKEVTVTLESSNFPVFVNGAVIRPGKITSDRPLTALEAIMEAGGFDYGKANLKAVKVIRTEESEVKNFTIDFRGVLEGRKSEPFYLKPSDIVYIPEKFTLF